MTLPTPDAAQVALTLTTLAAVWIGWAKVVGPWIKRRWTRFIGIFQAIAGRDPIIDKVTGKEISPALPPIGEQLASVNDTLGQLVQVIASNQNAHDRIDHVVDDLRIVKTDVLALKTAAVERIVTKDESAQMWRAVANGDLIPGETDES